MNVIKTDIEGVVIIEPKIFGDSRGYFYESYSQRDFEEKMGRVNFVQDNQSFSHYGVLRGLHFQNPPYTQSKLVRVIHGKVVDVAVDIRKGSPTYGKYVAVELTGENHRQFFIPKGFAHGFVVLSETALFQYKCDESYHPEAEGAIMWNDPDLAIEWPVKAEDIELSEKDKHHPFLKDFESPFVYNR
jgi:dTDP-4-dehydrorhamnose 3,5-epimerase